MIISDALECCRCHKRLCECREHLVYDGHDFCSTDCVLDYIDKDIYEGEQVVSTAAFKEMEMCQQAEWNKDARQAWLARWEN